MPNCIDGVLKNGLARVFFSILLLALIPHAVFAGGHEPNSDNDSGGLSASGYVRTLMEFEQDEIGGDDFDAAAYLSLNVSPKNDDRFSFHFYGRARADLNHDSETDEALDRADTRVFQAYLKIEGASATSPSIQLGRQWLFDIEGVYLDGARVSLPVFRELEFVVFGGRPVPAYSSADGQSIFGGQIYYQPFEPTQIRVDFVRADEQNPLVNDHVGLHLSQKFGKNMRGTYDQKFLNNRNKDLRLGFSAFIPFISSELLTSYYERTSTSPSIDRDDIEARYFSDYYLLLGQIQELRRYSANLIKYFGEHLILGGGFSSTHVHEKDNPYNRDSDRYFVTFGFLDAFIENLNFTLDMNWVRSDFSSTSVTLFTDVDGSQDLRTTSLKQEDDSFFVTGEVEYEFSEDLEASLGCSYADYDFSRLHETSQPLADLVPRPLLFTTGSQQFITRTYFVELDWRITDSWRTRILLEYDRSKINSDLGKENYWRGVGSLTYSF